MAAPQPSPVDLLIEIRDYMKSLDATMLHILALTELRMKSAINNTKAAAGRNVAAAEAINADLDSPHGNPTINAKDPRDWTGEPMNGRKFSECPPEYLELLATRFDYFAGKEEDAKKRDYNKKDATRARCWAERIRNGWKAPTRQEQAEQQTNPFAEDRIDF